MCVGATRFELATSRPPAERATKLRHAPISYAKSIILTLSEKVNQFRKKTVIKQQGTFSPVLQIHAKFAITVQTKKITEVYHGAFDHPGRI